MAEKPTYEELEKKVQKLEKTESELKLSQEKLRESEERFTLAVKNSNLGMWDWNIKTGELAYSEYLTKMLGYEGNELQPNVSIYRSFVHPDDRSMVMDAIISHFKNDDSEFNIEFRMKTKSGGWRWINSRGKVVARDTDKRASRMVGTHIDITENKIFREMLQQSEGKYRDLIDKLDDIIWTLDLNLHTTYVSPSIKKKLGFTPEERMAQDPGEQMTPSSYAKVTELLMQELSREKEGSADPNRTIKVEVEFYHKNSSTLWTENVISGIRDENGILIGIHGVSRDINDRKKAEGALKESEEKYRALVETTSDWVWEVDQNGIYNYVNPKVTDMLGYDPMEVMGKTPFDFMPSDEAERIGEIFKKSVAACEPFVGLENINLHKDGRQVVLETNAVPILDSSGNMMGYRGIDRDITDRKQAEKKLRESEIKHKALVQNIPGMVYRAHADWSAEIISGSEEISGYTNEELNSRKESWLSIIHPDDRDEVLREGTVLANEQKDAVQRYRIVTKNGDIRWIEDRKVSLFSKKGEFQGIEGIVFDITDHMQMEMALLGSEERYRNIVERTDDLIAQVNGKARFTYVNHIAEEIFGLPKDECIGASVFDFIHTDDKDRMILWFNESVGGHEEKSTIEHRVVNKITGKIHDMLWTCNFSYDQKGSLIHINSTGKDLTDYKSLKARLMQVQKMEAIATLAGGVAHQFNNALSVITGNLELLETHALGDENIANYMKPMRETAHRMARLTNQLLAYARGGKYQDTIISPSDFVRETLPLIKYTMRPEINIDTNLPRGILPVKADTTQMQMVFSAVMQNASEAIEGDGRILISTQNKEIDKAYADNYEGLKPGSYVSFTIEDDGKGMDEETRKQVFEPFFTTKFQGRGLGMAAAYGIVKNHNGYISVESELGKGTTVRFLLPVALEKTRTTDND